METSSQISVTMVITAFVSIISIYAFSKPSIYQKLIMNPFIVGRMKQYYRMLTSGFIHADWAHLLFNMFAFYSFGIVIERMLDGWHLALLFLFGIVISIIPTYYKFKEVPHYNALGASGGVSAVVFCYIIFNPLNKLMILPIPIPIDAFILGILYLIYSYYRDKSSGDNINHSAHLYGALFGIVYAFVVAPEIASQFFNKISHWKGLW